MAKNSQAQHLPLLLLQGLQARIRWQVLLLLQLRLLQATPVQTTVAQADPLAPNLTLHSTQHTQAQHSTSSEMSS
jgi:hypothetical protein